jgi:hypothetical protein
MIGGLIPLFIPNMIFFSFILFPIQVCIIYIDIYIYTYAYYYSAYYSPSFFWRTGPLETPGFAAEAEPGDGASGADDLCGAAMSSGAGRVIPISVES